MTPEAKLLGDEIAEMLDSGEYGWAAATLCGIGKSIEATGTVTDGQRRAVANISRAGSRRNEAPSQRNTGRSRRYEGWTR